MTQGPQKNNSALIIGAIITVIGSVIVALIYVNGNYGVEKMRQEAELTQIALVSQLTQVALQNTVNVPTESLAPTSAPLPTVASVANTPAPSSNDKRDIAAQTLGYANLDGFIVAFGIPAEVKSRIFVCPNEETWCLGVYEEPGQADFHFKNITNCTIDGKQANGTSTIPSGFDGMVKGFTLRPCSR